MSPDEAKVLGALDGTEWRAASALTVKPAAARDAAVDALVARGLIEKRAGKRSYECLLTPAGVEERAKVPPPPARRTRAPAGDGAALREAIAGVIDERVASRLAHLEFLVEGLRDRLTTPAPAPPSAPPPSRDGLVVAILQSVLKLHEEPQWGGLVPIPILRHELRRLGEGSADVDVDALLIRLEKLRVLQLLVANSPATLPESDRGIDRPGRGLLYYVAPRAK